MSFWTWFALGALTYLVVGVVWSRSQAVRLQHCLSRAQEGADGCPRSSGHYSEWCEHALPPWWARASSREANLHVGLSLHALLWPFFAPPNLLMALSRTVLAAPVQARRREVQQLRERRATWELVRDDQDAPVAARDAAEALIRELDERIAERAL